MSSKLLLQFGLAALLIFLVAFGIYLSRDRDHLSDPFAKNVDAEGDAILPRTPRDPVVSPRTDGKVDPDSGEVVAGGVKRPASDLPAESRKNPEEGLQEDVGRTPAFARDTNVQVALAAEAVESGNHPEWLSPMHPPKTAFDPQAYASDAQAKAEYLRKASQ